jgi:hypothetical protein
MDSILDAVYINGHVIERSNVSISHHYAFFDTAKNLTFYPENIGVDVHPMAECLVKLTVDTYSKLITCNPHAAERDEENQESNEPTRGSHLARLTQ